MPKYRVTDTVTYARTWTVEAASEDDAINAVESGDWDGIDFSEEQIEASGYEAVAYAEAEGEELADA